MVAEQYIPLLDYVGQERLTIIEVYRMIDNNEVQYKITKKNKYLIKI